MCFDVCGDKTIDKFSTSATSHPTLTKLKPVHDEATLQAIRRLKAQILNTETLIRQLVYDEATGKLSVEGTANQDTPAMTKGKVVMFGLDVWEHGEIRSYRD